MNKCISYMIMNTLAHHLRYCRHLFLSCLLLLPVMVSASEVAIITTDFVMPRKFELMQEAAVASGVNIRWATVGVDAPEQAETLLREADLIILDAPRSDDQALVLNAVGAVLRELEVPLVSINVMSPPLRLSAQRIELAQAQRLFEYYAGGMVVNYARMGEYLHALLNAGDLSAVAEPLLMPETGIYHPQFDERVFHSVAHYVEWQQQRGYAPDTHPVLGMEISSSYISDGQTAVIDDFVQRSEANGAMPLVFFRSTRVTAARQEGEGRGRPQSQVPMGTANVGDLNEFPNPLPPAEQASLSEIVLHQGEVLPDVMVVYSFLGSNPEGRKQLLQAMGVPAINAIQYREGDYALYLADNAGISNFGIPYDLVAAEYIGLIDSLVVATDEGGQYVPVPEQMDRLMGKLFNLLRLRQKDNAEKQLALLFWNHPPGEHNMGASNLNVPASVVALLADLQQAGYRVEGMAEDTLIERISTLLRPFYRVDGLQQLLDTEHWDLLPLEHYESWFAQLPAAQQQAVLEHFGMPAHSHWLVEHEGERGFAIPRLALGNLVLLPQPARSDQPAETDDALYHDTTVPPHHAYLATYLWAREQLGVDAFIHFGTHGSQEWLPGKERGLWAHDFPNLLVGDVPVVYPYIVDNMSEAVHVKRRGRGVVISHQTPPFSPAGLSDDFVAINDSIREYHMLDEGLVRQNSQRLIIDQAVAMNIHQDLDWRVADLQQHFDEFLRDIEDYLEDLGMAMQPLGLHSFGQRARDEHLASTVMQMLGEELVLALGYDSVGELFRIDYNELVNTAPFRFVAEHVLDDLPLATPDPALQALQDRGQMHLNALAAEGETRALLAALEGAWVDPSYGGDPIRNPDALPTGRNMYGFDPGRVPTRAAYEAGREAMQSLILDHQRIHNEYPRKLAFAMRSTETVRHLGMLEAQVFDALGVRPVWDSGGRVTGVELVPLEELGRPRLDVVISITGLYRDQYPMVMERFNEAVLLAAEAQEPAELNYVRANTEQLTESLSKAGLDHSSARHAALTRVFGNESGDYGTGLPEATLMSDHWEADDGQLAEIYLNRMSWSYGPDPARWSEKLVDASGASINLYAEQLRGTSAAVMSRSSNLRGLLDTDHSFEYLGGISLAVQHLDGTAPQMYIANLRDPNRARLQAAERFLATELRAVYQHPNWIAEMQAEGYAGTLELLNTINNFWGWQVMDRNIVRDDQWQEFHASYVMDRYDLGLREWLEDYNPEALAQIAERMLEAVRHGYWDASEQTRRELVQTYAELAEAHDIFTANSTFLAYVEELAQGYGIGADAALTEAANPAPPSAEALDSAAESVAVQGQVLSPVNSESIQLRGWDYGYLLVLLIIFAGFWSRINDTRRCYLIIRRQEEK